MKMFVSRNPRAAMVGGEGGIENLARGYWRAQFGLRPAQGIVLEDSSPAAPGEPIWPIIYYTMRAGDLQVFCLIFHSPFLSFPHL